MGEVVQLARGSSVRPKRPWVHGPSRRKVNGPSEHTLRGLVLAIIAVSRFQAEGWELGVEKMRGVGTPQLCLI